MKKKIICASIAIATMCFALFLWRLSGSAFERSPIFDIFKENGGEASVDDVLIGIFRKTGNVIKRHSVVARLYRMKKNGIVARKNLKGVYVLKKG